MHGRDISGIEGEAGIRVAPIYEQLCSIRSVCDCQQGHVGNRTLLSLQAASLSLKYCEAEAEQKRSWIRSQKRPHKATRGSHAHCKPVVDPKINKFLARARASARGRGLHIWALPAGSFRPTRAARRLSVCLPLCLQGGCQACMSTWTA
jgi:hypothetical protein